MTKLLTELITDQTPILNLEQNYDISRKEKLSVLDLKSNASIIYSDYMYYFNDIWYYFKCDRNDTNAFYMIEELMGTYLAKVRHLPTVTYEVAKLNDKFGLASKNFKQGEFRYYLLNQLIDNVYSLTGIQRIDILKSFTVDDINENEFLNHLFNMLALDVHMLQEDRCNVNVQFQINRKNNYFGIAPLYDYSKCASKIGSDGLNIKTLIIHIDDENIVTLLKKYDVFRKALEMCLDQNMKAVWDQICADYHFNQDCSAYERIKDYYGIKDKSQKQYIKGILRDIK